MNNKAVGTAITIVSLRHTCGLSGFQQKLQTADHDPLSFNNHRPPIKATENDASARSFRYPLAVDNKTGIDYGIWLVC